MGEIAEGMLEGVFCQYCGVYLGDEVGYPRSCAACEDEANTLHIVSSEPKEKTECPICGKLRKGVEEHIRDSHLCPYCGVLKKGLKAHIEAKHPDEAGPEEKHDQEGPEKKSDRSGPVKQPDDAGPQKQPEKPRFQ